MSHLIRLVPAVFAFVPFALSAQEADSSNPTHPLVGQPAVVTKWNTELKAGEDVVGHLQLGEIVRPSAARPGWLWIPGKQGWVREKEIFSPDAALAHFDQLLERNPKGETYRDRAVLRAALGQWDHAVADFNEAIRHGLDTADVYAARGNALLDLERYTEALRDLNTALDKNDKLVTAYELRGTVHLSLNRYGEALQDYKRAVDLSPGFATAWNNIGWINATCPDERFRDGAVAVNAAKKGCDLTEFKNPFFIDTLAAAYAEVAEFDAAIQWADRARQMLPEEERGDIEQRLELYRQNKPYREE